MPSWLTPSTKHLFGHGSFTFPPGTDISAPPSYPLLGYAAQLEKIGVALKMVSANASLDPPVLRWDGTTMRAPSMVRVPGRHLDWRDADYAEGGHYLVLIRPTCRNPAIRTAQQHWLTALQFSAPSVLEREFGIPQLATYASQAQALFDIAHDTVRGAFRDSVAATYGRISATRTGGHGSPWALVAWLHALTEWGCCVEEC